MRLDFWQTGDPWHDWGLCELYEAALDPSLQGVLQVSPPMDAGFSISTDLTPEEFGRAIHRVLSRSDRWNALHPRFEEGKKIDRCKPRTVSGRRLPGEKYEPKVSKEEWTAAACRGRLPSVARNRCQRIACVPLTPSQLHKLMSPEGGKDSFEEIARDAAQTGVTVSITQAANPLVAKHHSNAKVRGPAANNAALTASSCFLLPCFCATVSPWKPFLKESDDCVVLLPENLPFPRTHRLWQHFRHCGALVHPDEANGEMSRNLPLHADGDEARLLVLLDALQDRLAVREDVGLFDEDLPLLNDWTAIHFSTGKNVTVGVIHRIEVPGAVFPLLRPVPAPAGWQQPRSVAFVRDCLTGLRVDDTPVQSRIAKSLFLIHGNAAEAWRGLETGALELYKNVDRAEKTTRAAARLLPHFYHHFARSLLTMTDQQLESCRKIGELAGSAFHRDVTILSRLHNTSSPGDFRANLELLAFRLFKASNGDDRGGLWHIGGDEFRSIFDLATTEEWQAAAQTISAFASLRAFNQNLGEGRQAQ